MRYLIKKKKKCIKAPTKKKLEYPINTNDYMGFIIIIFLRIFNLDSFIFLCLKLESIEYLCINYIKKNIFSMCSNLYKNLFLSSCVSFIKDEQSEGQENLFYKKVKKKTNLLFALC